MRLLLAAVLVLLTCAGPAAARRLVHYCRDGVPSAPPRTGNFYGCDADFTTDGVCTYSFKRWILRQCRRNDHCCPGRGFQVPLNGKRHRRVVRCHRILDCRRGASSFTSPLGCGPAGTFSDRPDTPRGSTRRALP